jgi:hypothetical protein
MKESFGVDLLDHLEVFLRCNPKQRGMLLAAAA